MIERIEKKDFERMLRKNVKIRNRRRDKEKRRKKDAKI